MIDHAMKPLAALLIAGALPFAAQAQAGSDRDSSIAQISDSSSVPLPAPESRPTAEAPDQLGSADESRPSASQLTKAGTASVPAQQVSTGGRDARPPQPLSEPAEGRTTAIEAVAGHDRCDPAQEERSEQRRCASVIENRAAEFNRSEAPVLSPEQRLLRDQQLRESATDFEQAARKLAKTGESDDSLESLGVAAVALRAQPAPTTDEEPEDSAQGEATAAIINALVNGSSPVPPQ